MGLKSACTGIDGTEVPIVGPQNEVRYVGEVGKKAY